MAISLQLGGSSSANILEAWQPPYEAPRTTTVRIEDWDILNRAGPNTVPVRLFSWRRGRGQSFVLCIDRARTFYRGGFRPMLELYDAGGKGVFASGRLSKMDRLQ